MSNKKHANQSMRNMTQVVRGFVFEEQHGNGLYEIGKKGVAGVCVSNQREVTQTDENGYFSLPIYEDCFIFISKPNGYEYPLNEFNQPQFYYQYQPEGTPAGLGMVYEGIEPTGELPDCLHFPLRKSAKKEKFRAIMMGDIQPKERVNINHFIDIVGKELMKHEVDFFVPIGDIAWDDLSFYPELKEALALVGMPYYPVTGNHDLNFKDPTGYFINDTYKKYFGPTYYSFNHGKVHFVVLNDIDYTGWNKEEEEKGITSGRISDKQLEWVARDLKYVPEDHLIVFLMHIPLYTAMAPDHAYRNVSNREALFELVKNRPYLLTISAHTHCIEHVDLKEVGWNGYAPFPALIAGAACGAWWKGPKDFQGLPIRLGVDGSPNGFYIFDFDGYEFDFEFIPAGYAPDFQMSVRFPMGEVEMNSLSDQQILVNIFNASLRAEVVCTIDDGLEIPMERSPMLDPYVVEFIEKHPNDYPAWMKARKAAHIWTANYPDGLSLGNHILKIVAKEPNGKKYTLKQPFRVTAIDEGQANKIVLEPSKVSM